MNRKPSTAKKADSTAAKRKTARKPKAKTKAASKKVVLATAEGIEPEMVTEDPPKHPGGRPTEYRAEYAEQAKKLCEVGFTDQQLAEWFGVAKQTIYNWQAAHPEFLYSIKLGKDAPDDRTERSLYHRANGFEWYEEQPFKLKEVRWENGNRIESERVEVVRVLRVAPPDATSAIFWLKNRRGWKDKSEIDHGVTDALAALLGQIDGNGASIV
jgi:hypothetical protein